MTISIVWFALLHAAFALKHFLADFVFLLDRMASGKEKARGWVVALAAHAVLTLLLVLVIAPGLWWLGSPRDQLRPNGQGLGSEPDGAR